MPALRRSLLRLPRSKCHAGFTTDEIRFPTIDKAARMPHKMRNERRPKNQSNGIVAMMTYFKAGKIVPRGENLPSVIAFSRLLSSFQIL
jgi:hypothetical protein